MLKETRQNVQHILAFNFLDEQRIVYLEQPEYSIGRHRSSSIVINSEAISRHHATIVQQLQQNGEWVFSIFDGNRQGDLSRNGIIINGKKCFSHELKHGDIIQFGSDIKANYYILKKESKDFIKSILSKVPLDPQQTNHLQRQDESKQTLICNNDTLEILSWDLVKLASLVELNPNPIIEITDQGKLTYVNSAASIKFPNLQKDQIKHPLLQGLIQYNTHLNGNLLIREIEINQEVFEQHIHYLSQDRLIRSYIFDITQRKQAENHLKHQAFHDSLTGLPNRDFFNEHLSLALANAQKHQTLMAVLFVDIDGFKKINDTLGHTIGDRILQHFSQQLRSQLRQGDIVCRWGGDEFTVLLPQVKYPDEVAKLAQRLLDTHKQPILVDEHQIYLKNSIGIAIYPQDGEDKETLLRHADAALYRTKEWGRNHYQFYSPTMTSEISEHFQLENQLHQAIIKEELLLYYQPQINIKTGKIYGVEALIRWQKPGVGLVPPNEFIPFAEKTGLIIPIGEWVLRKACGQNKIWQKMGIPPVRVAVNLSAQQFQQPSLVELVEQVLQSTGLAPQWLELEVTESALMKNINLARQTLEKLKQMGVCTSMDDFGTGYSSLGYLKQFPFHTLKIDQTFVRDLSNNAQDLAIISAVMTLGRGFNLRIVAEGVENKHQLELLRELDCEEMQGYFFSRPLDSDKILDFLINFNLRGF